MYKSYRILDTVVGAGCSAGSRNELKQGQRVRRARRRLQRRPAQAGCLRRVRRRRQRRLGAGSIRPGVGPQASQCTGGPAQVIRRRLASSLAQARGAGCHFSGAGCSAGCCRGIGPRHIVFARRQISIRDSETSPQRSAVHQSSNASGIPPS